MRRLNDALDADGGMARLLAGAGAAQLLAAQDVAASAGVPPKELPKELPVRQEDTKPPAQQAPATEECTSPAPAADGEPHGDGEPQGDGGGQGAGAALGPALAAVLESEREAVYGYQAALTRLDPAATAKASALLAEHVDLADEAEAYAALHCSVLPPAQPGYVLDASFLNAPAAGLARLESGILTALGDVVALSAGPTRDWAVQALVAAAHRTVLWGGDPGAVPGLALDGFGLPPLAEMPADAFPTSSPAAT
jgi:hypothetical protein